MKDWQNEPRLPYTLSYPHCSSPCANKHRFVTEVTRVEVVKSLLPKPTETTQSHFKG